MSFPVQSCHVIPCAIVPCSKLTVPHCLLDSFAKIAAPNTMRPPRGIETCGILAGHEDVSGSGGYTVTHLVIPSQRAGADFCEMLNEDQLLAYCLREGLITLGWVHVSGRPAAASAQWQRSAAALKGVLQQLLLVAAACATPVHCPSARSFLPRFPPLPPPPRPLLPPRISACLQTHPSQDCFMSSLDQHTQCGFQSMLPEAIAIVLAPTDARSPFAVFRLTDDPARGSGLELIQRCERTGFHPHEADFQIYETSSHCVWRADRQLAIVDLR